MNLGWQGNIGSKSKLHSYMKHKQHMKTENYLTLNNNKHEQFALAQIWCEALSLLTMDNLHLNRLVVDV